MEKDTQSSVICGSESATMLKDLVCGAERILDLKIGVAIQLPAMGDRNNTETLAGRMKVCQTISTASWSAGANRLVYHRAF